MKRSDSIINTYKSLALSHYANGTNWWSCLRYNTNNAWNVNGNNGNFDNNNLYNTNSVLPVSNFI